ncbi:hypothetical protein SEA_ARCHERNM_66 [Mycobacterium phage ArcherNM]|uniref:hypothetical protein n=1 Tax=Mycobacterium phage ArcherNM TaxID=1815972 RepID=UPI00078BAC53|nr:hypothetical protein BJD71_gp66 [Mycobacterium phage ArcherNM]AMS01060.1 hypothetical protein SEA_ARCHERNM_66 [Mycobacterium phage ArcherNM]
MREYRTTIDLDSETRYTYVELGAHPDKPAWHHLAEPNRYPFPSEQAAWRFAEAHKVPGRKVQVLTTDGERFDL